MNIKINVNELPSQKIGTYNYNQDYIEVRPLLGKDFITLKDVFMNRLFSSMDFSKLNMENMDMNKEIFSNINLSRDFLGMIVKFIYDIVKDLIMNYPHKEEIQFFDYCYILYKVIFYSRRKEYEFETSNGEVRKIKVDHNELTYVINKYDKNEFIFRFSSDEEYNYILSVVEGMNPQPIIKKEFLLQPFSFPNYLNISKDYSEILPFGKNNKIIFDNLYFESVEQIISIFNKYQSLISFGINKNGVFLFCPLIISMFSDMFFGKLY